MRNGAIVNELFDGGPGYMRSSSIEIGARKAIAPDKKTTASVIGNFKQVVKDGDLRLHPIIGRLVEKEV